MGKKDGWSDFNWARDKRKEPVTEGPEMKRVFCGCRGIFAGRICTQYPECECGRNDGFAAQEAQS